MARKRKAEVMFEKEVVKRQKLEQELAIYKSKHNYQENVTRAKKSYLTTKNWNDCTRQQKCNRKKNLAENNKDTLNFCDNKGFEPTVVELKIKTREHVKFSMSAPGSFLIKYLHQAVMM